MKFKEVIYGKIKSGKLSFKSEREIISAVCAHPKSQKERKIAKQAIAELLKEGALVRDIKRRICTAEQLKTFKGTVRANPRGFAFITPEIGESDFFVPPSSLFGALDGDRVLFARVQGTADEAYVVKILKRCEKKIIGTFEIERSDGWVVSDDGKFPDVYIPLSLALNAKDGDKVVCEVTAYPSNASPVGKICEVLGEGGRLEVEQLSIIRAHGLIKEFSTEAEAEASAAAEKPVSLDGRRDLRDKLIFTIDGEDTRDIDDAVSLEIKDKKYILGVHIADVSEYVEFRKTLDNEAYSRGTSVYFPDSVYPMLPKALSNGACSLNEGEDRYALSCEMTFNESGEREKYEIFKSVIKSSRRLTYTHVNAVLEGKADEQIEATVFAMKELCLKLKGLRKAAGEVNLDVKEAKIYVENGEIVIPDYERGVAERIIEQFMISANEAVAEFLGENELPCLYRIHEKPTPEKCETLISFARDLGINARLDCENARPKDFAAILYAAEDKPYSQILNKVMLRSMQKARYCEKNEGHFGLASSCYCHFTSPIRRYPDLFVHRVLTAKLNGDIGKAKSYEKNAACAGRELSDRERIAEECEREVDSLYKLFYMEKHIGEVFDGVISGVADFGVFCELKNTVEGMIPIEYLPADTYEFFEEKFLLKRRRHSYKLGDQISIRVENCDLGRLRVHFSPLEQ